MAETILVCVNFRPFSGQPSCQFRGSRTLADTLREEIRRRGLDIVVEETVCMGHCAVGPNFRRLGGEFVHEASEDKLFDLLDRIEAGETRSQNQSDGSKGDD